MEENKKLNYVHKDSGSLRQSFSEASEAKQEDIHRTKAELFFFFDEVLDFLSDDRSLTSAGAGDNK